MVDIHCHILPNVDDGPIDIEESINMAKIMKCYLDNNIYVPIRDDHVTTLKDEKTNIAGYGDLGRLFAIGYLKGILEALNEK